MARDLAPLPPGDVALFDNEVPAEYGGSYRVTVTHTLEARVNERALEPITAEGELHAVQEIVVTAPQFGLAASEIVSRHPPAASSGMFGGELPHIVFRESALPWEREIASPGGAKQPWLALLVLTPEEIVGGDESPVRAQTTAIETFGQPDPALFKPAVTVEDDVDRTQSCSFITIAAATFTSVMPRLDELRYLAHCRQANVSDKAAQKLDPDGFFSVVIANRFPARPEAGGEPRKNIVHLVSLEGLEALLTAAPDFHGHPYVALLSLASWTFECQADSGADFRGLVTRLTASDTAFRLPSPQGAAGPDAAAAAEVADRLKNGFVPLAYRTRTGEDTFAWYRGPFSPVPTGPLPQGSAFVSSDAAIAYQERFGTFDMSLASAWQTGRALALADKTFAQRLLEWRRRLNRLADSLLSRAQHPGLHAGLHAILDSALLAALHRASTTRPPAQRRVADSPARVEARHALHAVLDDPGVRKTIADAAVKDGDEVAAWLGRLLLLYPVPFNALVADDRLLPAESLRFFHVDDNWRMALLDGALSLGLESTRHTRLDDITRDAIRAAAREAALTMRGAMTGVEPPQPGVDRGRTTGLLLRSALVSGWPTVAVRPQRTDGSMLRILRMDHLSSNVLFCLLAGVPDRVEISEPQEGVRFGVDEHGSVTLRNLASGKQTGQHGIVTRPGGRTLRLEPASKDGFVQTIETAVRDAGGGSVPAFGSAAFALQMVKAPEAVTFVSRHGEAH